MLTKLLDDVEAAAAILKSGGIVAFPTETVYGLGVDASCGEAVERLFVAKGRPSDNPLIVHLACLEDWPLAVSHLTESAKVLLEAFSPGPLTVVLPKNDHIAPQVTSGLQTVGIRLPELPIARDLIRCCGLPIAAPSANRSGRPSCTNWESVREDMDSRIDAILKAKQHELASNRP